MSLSGDTALGAMVLPKCQGGEDANVVCIVDARTGDTSQSRREKIVSNEHQGGE